LKVRLSVNEDVTNFIKRFSAEEPVGNLLSGLMQVVGVPAAHAADVGYQLFGVACFAFMGYVLYWFARRK